MSRRTAPAAERNKDPILEVLRAALPSQGTVLEVASGTGQHVVHFAAALPALKWQPSDPDADARASIAAWTAERGLSNVSGPLALDVLQDPWPVAQADAVLCINMIHISPWEATEALMKGSAASLPAGGPLVLYGPYRQGGSHTAPSNEAFDADLRARNPAWGVRDLEAVVGLAASVGLLLERVVAMPANNLCVVLRRA